MNEDQFFALKTAKSLNPLHFITGILVLLLGSWMMLITLGILLAR